MKDYLYETYIKKMITINSDGKRIVKEDDIDNLKISDEEKRFIKQIIENDMNLVLDTSLVSKKDRPRRVSDYSYGEKKGFRSRRFEEASKAKTEYQSDSLIFGDFNELIDFLETEFIPENIKLTRKRGTKDCIPSIQLNKIVRLRLSEEEMEYTINYLGAQGIRVGGYEESLESEFDNYDFIRTYKSGSNKAKLMDSATQMAYIIQYKKYPDDSLLTEDQLKNKIALRNIIIESIMRLVPYAAWKYSYLFGFDMDDLCQDGYESLFEALEKYDPTKGASIATYAMIHIKKAIYQHMARSLIGVTSNDTANFIAAKREVETSNNTTVKDHPELFEDIIQIMINLGSYPNQARSFVHRAKLNIGYISIEQDTEVLDKEFITPDDYYTLPQEIEVDNAIGIEKLLDCLTDRERFVIECRCGFKTGEVETLEEVAVKLGVTRERIRQIEAKALRKMRGLARHLRLDLNSFNNLHANEREVAKFGLSDGVSKTTPIR